jgi:FlaA1/EpsC-like NDP-sugar epimerase
MQRELLKSAEKLGINGQEVLHAIIADIRFPERLESIFACHKPQVVFHAAAHKHVPLMELNPAEAVTNNIIGTRNLVNVSVAHGVERFVMISTDKAVNPTNIMGAAKRMAELLVMRAAREHGLPYATVRFGNVLGSRGSVVLTFKEQIALGGPITITDPRMTRYFMTIPEAVQLVLQAAVLGKRDEIFVLDMGEPVKIVDMARDLIELSGLVPGEDIDIVFTGCRPGEKLHEELFMENENYKRTNHEKIFVAANGSSFVSDDLDDVVNRLHAAALIDDRPAIYEQLQQALPDFNPAYSHLDNALTNESGEWQKSSFNTQRVLYKSDHLLTSKPRAFLN